MKLVPKNWRDFQHYKDRNPPWIRLHKGLLDNFDFQRLPVASRALAPMLWLLASDSLDGVIDADPEVLAFRLRMNIEEVKAALKPLIDKGFFLVHEPASTPLADRLHGAVPEAEAEAEASSETEKEAAVAAGKPAVELTKEEVWKAGKSLLMASGVHKDQCGSFVGKLVKDYGDVIALEAVRAAVYATPADPREYLKATCMRLKGDRKDTGPPLTVDSKAAEQTQALLKQQEEHGKAAVPPPAEVLEKLNRLKRGVGAQA